MIEIAGAILPVVFLIVLGKLLKRIKFLDKSFWVSADQLTYYLFLPALLCGSLAVADLDNVPIDGAIVAPMACLLAVVGALLALRSPLGFSGPAFGSVVQGSIRPNTYIGLAIAFGLYQEDSLTAVALAIVVFMPLVNLISILTLAHFGKDSGSSWREIIKLVVTNPLIIGCALGLAINLSGGELPTPAADILTILGRAALPLGLISVGAGLDLAAMRSSGRPVVTASLFKLAILPALVLLGLNALELDGQTPAILLLFAAAPASVSSYILARQMGGDAKLMAGIITWQTVLSMVTIPAWLWIKDYFI